MAEITIDERWYLTEDGKERVKGNDPRGRYLLWPEGTVIQQEAFDEIPEAKAIEEPPHNKSIRHHSKKQE